MKTFNPFTYDPWEDLLNKVTEVLVFLLSEIFSALFDVAALDLDATWFREVYGGILWLALAMWLCFMVFNAVMYGAKKISGSELVENLTVRGLGFIFFATFGPMFAQSLSYLTATVSANILAWGAGSSASEVVDGLLPRIGELKNTGAGILGALFVLGMWQVAMIGIAMAVLVITFFQYISVVLFPALFVFYTSAKHRHVAKKALGMTIALFLALPLMCLAVAMAFRMFGAGVNEAGTHNVFTDGVDDQAADFWFMLVGGFGVLAAVFVPAMVMKFAWGVGAGAATAMKGIGAGGGGAAAATGSTARAATNTTATLGAAAAGTAVAPGVGTAIGGGAAAGGATAGGAAAGGATATATKTSAAAASGAGKTSAGAAKTAQLSQATDRAAQQATYGSAHSTQTATQGMHLAQADENEAGRTDE